MNIICNNCVGARIYQILNIPFNNPFMWNVILPNDFIYMIQHFNAINFNNIEIINECCKPFHDKTYGLLVDKKIKVFYVHHKFDKNAIKPEKKGMDLFYSKIEDYIIDAWNRRYVRMQNEMPHFIAAPNGYWNYNDVMHYMQLNTQFKRTLIVYDKKYLNINNNALLKIIYIEKSISTLQIANDLINECKKINYVL